MLVQTQLREKDEDGIKLMDVGAVQWAVAASNGSSTREKCNHKT